MDEQPPDRFARLYQDLNAQHEQSLEGLLTALHGELAPTLDANADSCEEGANRRSQKLFPQRRWSSMSVAKYAAGAMVTVALVAAFIVGNPFTVSFAAVQERLRKVNNLQFRVTTTWQVEAPISRTAEVSCLGSRFLRSQSNDGELILADRKRRIIMRIIPDRREVVVSEDTDTGVNPIPDVLALLIEIPESSLKQQRSNDQNTLRYSFTMGDFAGTALVNARTMLPVSVEISRSTDTIGTFTESGSSNHVDIPVGTVITQRFDSFAYDTDIDESSFVFEAPEGYETIKRELDSYEESARGETRKRREEILRMQRARAAIDDARLPDSRD